MVARSSSFFCAFPFEDHKPQSGFTNNPHLGFSNQPALRFHKSTCAQVSQINLLSGFTNQPALKFHKSTCAQVSQINLRSSFTNLRAGRHATHCAQWLSACLQVQHCAPQSRQFRNRTHQTPISLRSGFTNQPALRFHNPKSWPTCFTLRIISEILTVCYNCQLEP